MIAAPLTPLPDDVALDSLEEFDQEPLVPPDPFAAISDETLLQIMNSAYTRSKDARATRQTRNHKNWDAFHGKFAFLTKKKPGQSAIVVPSLETSLEQVCAQLSQQLVGMSAWFTANFDGKNPPLLGLEPDQVARILRSALDRLAVAGGAMPTSYGMTRLVYDAIKLGLIESEVTAKVTIDVDEEPTYTLDGMGGITHGTRDVRRLHIELVPFDDYFPDPSQARQYDIHEVEVTVADLPAMGFTPEQIERIRQASPGSQKQEERRTRSGLNATEPTAQHRVLLREYWGDLIHPQTGALLARNAMFMTCASTYVVQRPVPIAERLGHNRRPFVNVPLLPTPTAQEHHAFLDIAVPLIEIESELTNLVIDGGFNAALGAKIVHAWKLADETAVSGGITPGLTAETKEGMDGTVIEKIDTGTLTQEMLTVLDRQSRMRQEAFRINDLQLGRMAARKSSATEITSIEEAGNDLFSNIALRFEDTWIEPVLELCWLTLWWEADDAMFERMTPIIGPEYVAALQAMSREERFVVFADAATFKVQGYKNQLSLTKNIQKLMMLRQTAAQNPALMQIISQEISPLKEYKMVLQSLGIDPTELQPDPGEPALDPALLGGQAGNPQGDPATNQAAGMAETAAPPNAMGTRGVQLP